MTFLIYLRPIAGKENVNNWKPSTNPSEGEDVSEQKEAVKRTVDGHPLGHGNVMGDLSSMRAYSLALALTMNFTAAISKSICQAELLHAF